MTYSLLQFGCGNMGGAMLTGWLASGIAPAAFTVVDPHLSEAPAGVRLLRSAPVGEAPVRFVLLGFKPQGLADAAQTIAPFVGAGTVVLSILAGVDLATLRARFPDAAAIVRVMPNLATRRASSPGAWGDAAASAAAPSTMASASRSA